MPQRQTCTAKWGKINCPCCYALTPSFSCSTRLETPGVPAATSHIEQPTFELNSVMKLVIWTLSEPVCCYPAGRARSVRRRCSSSRWDGCFLWHAIWQHGCRHGQHLCRWLPESGVHEDPNSPTQMDLWPRDSGQMDVLRSANVQPLEHLFCVCCLACVLSRHNTGCHYARALMSHCA